MTWSYANNSVNSCLILESRIPVISSFCHLVIILSKYILNSVGERGQPWRTPVLISSSFETNCLYLVKFRNHNIGITTKATSCNAITWKQW
jgi:hypothetical protein